MSTLSIAPVFLDRPVVRRPADRTDSTDRLGRTAREGRGLRLTRRGRVVLVLGFLGLALILTTALGGWAAATHDSARPDPVRVVTVQPGDTLYDLAGDVAAPGQVRSMVHRIQQLNSLPPDASLQVGQQIAVPTRR